MVGGDCGGDNLYGDSQIFSTLTKSGESSDNVLLFNMSFRVYQETPLFTMDAIFPSILKLYIYIKIQFRYHIIPSTGKHLLGNTTNILPLISSL